MAKVASIQKKQHDQLMKAVNKRFGEGTLIRMGDKPRMGPALTTGSLQLDEALGIGGLGVGRIIEMFGPESSGKTTIALSTLARVQASGGDAAYIDAEHAIDPTYASAIGVDLDSLLLSQPDYGEQALEVCDLLVRSGDFRLVVVDSVAALVPKSELEGEMGQAHVGAQPRMMSQAMRKISGVAEKTGTTVIFINQIREKVGVMFGTPETQPGGRALKFFSSQRIDIRVKEKIKGPDGEFIGNHVKAKVVKNKLAPPFRESEFDIMYGIGVSRPHSVLDAGVKFGVLTLRGSNYYLGEDRLGNSKAKAAAKLAEDFNVLNQIEQRVRAVAFPSSE